MRGFVLFAVCGLLLARSGEDYGKWRADYEAGLKAPDGWLSVAGLYWLHEGANTVTLTAGKTVAFTLEQGKTRYQGRLLKSDHDTVRVGDVILGPIERDGKVGIRVRDPNADTRRNFTGCKWFRATASWRLDARWVPYAKPRSIAITNILGMTDQEPSPGYAEFTLDGKQLRLEPVLEDGELFFLFKDATSGHSTYGAGRFLYAAMPRGDRVELDFNKAHNPPCAFTAFATCPLPPKQNVLPVAIEAGEKSYQQH